VGFAGQRERVWACVREERRRQDWPTGQWEGERGESAGARQADKRGAPVSAGGRSGTRVGWATLVFSISKEFLMPFIFIFSRVFNSNSNQVSNSN
jgi:hypothetical protein